MAYGSQKYLFKRDNYEVRRNTTDEQLDALWTALGVGGPGSGIGITDEVNTFAELPSAAGPVNITTTNIPGAMVIPFANDALVWAVSELAGNGGREARVRAL